MPGNTPNRGYKFPLGGEPPAGNLNVQDLALGVDSDVAGHIAAADPHPNYLNNARGDARYVNTAGDTMTGPLTLAADPASDMHAATRGYADRKAYGRAEWGASPLAAGTSRITLAPSKAVVVYNGMTWAGDNSGFVMPKPGLYAISVGLQYDHVNPGTFAPTCGIGSAAGALLWGSTDHSNMDNSPVRTFAQIIYAIDQGTTVSAWYSVQSGVSLINGYMIVAYFGATV